ncbi:hypothetical protein BASA62_006072, partial [Batrachochytrium salamandrivorans]
MDDSDECTGLFQTSVGVPCRHEIKMHIEENRRFNIDDIHCQWHLHAPPAVLPVAPNNDQVVVVMARLNEASQRSLQPLSNPELATKRGRPAGSTKRKAIQRESHYLSTRLGGNVRNVV